MGVVTRCVVCEKERKSSGIGWVTLVLFRLGDGDLDRHWDGHQHWYWDKHRHWSRDPHRGVMGSSDFERVYGLVRWRL